MLHGLGVAAHFCTANLVAQAGYWLSVNTHRQVLVRGCSLCAVGGIDADQPRWCLAGRPCCLFSREANPAICPSLPAHVPEPSVDETYQILLGLRERYEAHHKLRYTDDALDAAAKYSSQYISDRFLPDKARNFVPPLAPRSAYAALCPLCGISSIPMQAAWRACCTGNPGTLTACHTHCQCAKSRRAGGLEARSPIQPQLDSSMCQVQGLIGGVPRRARRRST